MIANQKPDALSGEKDASKNGKKLLERAWDALLAEGFAEPVARWVCVLDAGVYPVP